MCVCVYLNAPYRGLYQQTNEQGVKSMNQSMARPKSTPLDASTQNHDKQPNILANSVPVWTAREEQEKRDDEETSLMSYSYGT